MGGYLTRCCAWYRKSGEYEPLRDAKGMTIGADESNLQAIADEDDALLRDPTIQQVLAGVGSDDPPLDEDELNEYIRELDPQ